MDAKEMKLELMGIPGAEEMTDVQRLGLHLTDGLTMIGYERLCNLDDLISDVVRRGVPGDFIETGVWRGGACIYAKHVMDGLGSKKKVYVADSFRGLPPPDDKYPADAGDGHHLCSVLSVRMSEVCANFEKYDLLDNRVVFVKGWFKDTLPSLEGPFSIIRLDGDMYESTMDALVNLYGKLSSGGYVIIDDYGVVRGCHIAVDEFRESMGIRSPLTNIDGSGVFWKKP